MKKESNVLRVSNRKEYFSYFSTKSYVVGTQKNRLCFWSPKTYAKNIGNKINIYYLTLEYLIFCFIYACFCCCCCFGLAHWTVTRDFANAKAPFNAKRASTREQHSRRPACASAQSGQRLCYSLFRKYHM